MSLRHLIPAPARRLRRRVLERLRPESITFGLDRTNLGVDPWDRAASERAATELFEAPQKEHPAGTIGRGRLLLRLIEDSFPTQRLSEEYFQNLELILRTRHRRLNPGKVLLGLGSGRCGSTSLTALLRTVDDCCGTHENPPLIGWTPHDAEIEFHVRRFKLLSDYYAIVSDVSHWWLNALDDFFQHFPDGKAVALVRDVDNCAKSFMRIKGYGRGSFNNWAPPGNGVWKSTLWDRTYPNYPVPDYAKLLPDRAKYEMIVRYVEDYNERLRFRAARQPERIVLVRTEELSDPGVQARILGLVGASSKSFKRKLNVRNVTDGQSEEFVF
jgi:hypothetical protein